MTYYPINNRARVFKHCIFRIVLTTSLMGPSFLLSVLETSGAPLSPRYIPWIKKISEVYDIAPITPSPKKLIIEIQDTGPDISYLYIKALQESELFKARDEGLNAIKNVKTIESLRFNNVLLAKYDIKRTLEEKFPNASVIVTFIPLTERIEDARKWPDKINPIFIPLVSKPEIHYADIIVQLNFRQADSFGAHFNVSINAFTPDSKVPQFSTDYGGLWAERDLQKYHISFNEPVSSEQIKKIKKRKKYNDEWQRRYDFDRVFYKNIPDKNTYWNFRAEEFVRTSIASSSRPLQNVGYKSNKEVIKNYTSDFKTSPLYPLYLWTVNSMEEILKDKDWKNQRMKRIREWARSHEFEEAKISLLKDGFLETGHLSNDAFIRRVREIMEDEIINYKSIETENLIEPAIGETGYMARETLKKQDEKRITNEIVNGVFRPIGKVGNVALQLSPMLLYWPVYLPIPF